MTVSLFSGLVARQIDTDSAVVEGFEGEFTEYRMELLDVNFDGSAVSVTVNLIRNGSSAIIDDGMVRLVVGGAQVDSASDDPYSSGSRVTLSGPGSGGQLAEVVFWSDDWNVTMRVSTTVPSLPSPSDVAVTGLELTGGERRVDVWYEITNSAGAPAEVTVVMGIDWDGDGRVTRGAGEVANDNVHTVDANSPIHWSGDFFVGDVLPGTVENLPACVNIEDVAFL